MPVFPSDLCDLAWARAHAGQRVAVAGRVLTTGPRVDLGDRFATIEVRFAARGALDVGDLVVLEGLVGERGLDDAAVIERHTPAREPRDVLAPAAAPRALLERAAILKRVRAFFEAERFVEVETPCGVPSPGLDLHLDAFEAPGLGYLITSPEYQMKRLLVSGVPRCFQIARCFRRGELGANHNPEFTMLEWYRAFEGVEAVMDDTERLVRDVVLASRAELVVGGARVDLERPFARITVAEAFARFAGVAADEAIAMASADEERFFRLLVDRVEPALAAQHTGVFLTEYPAPFASLARKKPGDPRVAERFELYVGGLELCNGFGELTEPVEQRARLERDRDERARRGLAVYPIDERFLAALEQGMPPSAGNALGLDRLVMLALGAHAIGDVMAFPAAAL